MEKLPPNNIHCRTHRVSFNVVPNIGSTNKTDAMTLIQLRRFVYPSQKISSLLFTIRYCITNVIFSILVNMEVKCSQNLREGSCSEYVT